MISRTSALTDTHFFDTTTPNSPEPVSYAVDAQTTEAFRFSVHVSSRQDHPRQVQSTRTTTRIIHWFFVVVSQREPLSNKHGPFTMTGGCASPGCTNVTEQRLACPKCIQLGLPATYFCSQSCFKSNYSSHKSIHKLAKQILQARYVCCVV